MVTRVVLAVVCWTVLTGLAHAQPELETLERFRREYPTRMAPAQVGELLNRVAWEHRGSGWGLLRKTGGHRCPSPPHGVDVSCDILIHRPSGNHFDILADVENGAIPVWRDVGPCVISPSSGCSMSNFLEPVRPAQAPEPPPVTPPGQPPVSTPDPAVLQTLNDLRAYMEHLAGRQGQMQATLDDLAATTRETRDLVRVLASRPTASPIGSTQPPLPPLRWDTGTSTSVILRELAQVAGVVVSILAASGAF